MLAPFTKENINAVNIKCLISFCLALPGSNALIESVFSIINTLWSDEKTGNRNTESLEQPPNTVKTHFKRFLLFGVLFRNFERKILSGQVHNLINIHMNLGRLFQSKTYISFVYEFS
jgi:hypothetical protein